VLEAQAAAGEHALQILHHLLRLRFDALGIRRRLRSSRERHLAGDEEPAVGFDRVAERRHRVRRTLDHVKDR
jgi:hypothetical protein